MIKLWFLFLRISLHLEKSFSFVIYCALLSIQCIDTLSFIQFNDFIFVPEISRLFRTPRVSFMDHPPRARHVFSARAIDSFSNQCGGLSITRARGRSFPHWTVLVKLPTGVVLLELLRVLERAAILIAGLKVEA